MTKEVKATSDKKVLQQEVAYQIEHSLGKIKDLLGEKKFNSRVRKAVKLFTTGLKKDWKKSKKETTSAIPAKKNAPVKKADAKPVEKKSPAKKVAATKATKAVNSKAE